MDLQLVKANERDAIDLFAIQQIAFRPLLEKYKDYDTNPANETLDKVIKRLRNSSGMFYKIVYINQLVGGINVLWREGTHEYRISPMFISPEFQGIGIAQETLRMVESFYPLATSWELATIKEEERNCHLYEKCGYVQTEGPRKINENTTLIFYKKIMIK